MNVAVACGAPEPDIAADPVVEDGPVQGGDVGQLQCPYDTVIPSGRDPSCRDGVNLVNLAALDRPEAPAGGSGVVDRGGHKQRKAAHSGNSTRLEDHETEVPHQAVAPRRRLTSVLCMASVPGTCK